MSDKFGPSLDHLGLSVAFSAAYLDGIMEHEHREIRQQWKAIRDFLAKLPAKGGGEAAPELTSITFDSDTIVNGEMVKAGTVWHFGKGEVSINSSQYVQRDGPKA